MEHPPGVAIICGEVSGGFVCVPEVDDPELAGKLAPGLQGVTRLERTPHNGLHVYAISLAPVKTRKVADHVDCQGEGGIVVVWPTPGYERVGAETPILTVPNAEEWAAEELRPLNVTLTPHEQAHLTAGADIPHGQRQFVIPSIAGQLRRAGLRGDWLRQAIHAINRESCKPPLPEDDIEGLAQRLDIKTPKPLHYSDLTIIEMGQDLDGPDPEIPWIIEDLIPAGEITFLYGLPGCGKSYVALYIALHIAAGVSLWDRTVKPGAVAWADWEMSDDAFIQRTRALARGLGWSRVPLELIRIVPGGPC